MVIQYTAAVLVIFIVFVVEYNHSWTTMASNVLRKRISLSRIKT